MLQQVWKCDRPGSMDPFDPAHGAHSEGVAPQGCNIALRARVDRVPYDADAAPAASSRVGELAPQSSWADHRGLDAPPRDYPRPYLRATSLTEAWRIELAVALLER